jgi:hypothetical protein
VKVFFDECVPRPLRNLLPEHAIQTAQEMGWGRLKNGELIQRAEDSGFEVFCDERSKSALPAESDRTQNRTFDSIH